MLFDPIKANREKQSFEKFEELKNFIKSKDKKGKINEWYLAYEHIVSLELEIEQQKKQIEEYQNFFSLMRKFLPKESSIHDIIK